MSIICTYNRCLPDNFASLLYPAIVVRCSDVSYKCKDNQCISKLNPMCDGEIDCEDGSDEVGCSKSRITTFPC